MKNFSKWALLVVLLMGVSSCAADRQPTSSAPSTAGSHRSDTTDPVFKTLPFGRNGQHQYSLLLHRDIARLRRNAEAEDRATFLPGDALIVRESDPMRPAGFDAANYERIHVYAQGVFPDFTPNSPNQPSNSMFADDTFQELMAIGTIKDNVAFRTEFDEKKFVRIANNAVRDFEASLKPALKIVAQEEFAQEYIELLLVVEAPFQYAIGEFKFFVDESQVLASLIGTPSHGRIEHKYRYRLGVPAGKHQIKAAMAPLASEALTATVSVNNTYEPARTLHLVAIGINEFPRLGSGSTLSGAINDAQLVKTIFREKGAGLFGGRIEVTPYQLGPEQTTKENITKLIETAKANVKPNDYFVLFVASHGLIYDNMYFFAPSDTDFVFDYQEMLRHGREKLVNGFGEDQISDYLINIPTIFRLAILDTCHAGREVEGIKQLLAGMPLGKQSGISVLTAAKSTQAAADNYRGHGLFTYVLAQGLQGEADYNDDNVVDSIEISHYVKTRVSRVASSETRMAQDAVVLPDPAGHFNRRFELTKLDPKPAYQLRPNVFTPRESQLYINALQQSDGALMTGIIVNNERHGRIGEQAARIDLESPAQLVAALMQDSVADISISFGNNSSEVDASELPRLRTLAEALNDSRLRGKRIFIEGHSDSLGDRDYNMTLSQRRAEHVLQILATQFGISGDRMSALGYGELYPVGDNSTDAGRARNRRVSVFVY